YVVKDVQGNCSELNFQIRNNPSYQPKANPIKGERFAYNKVNKFSADHLQIEIPTETLYGDLDLLYNQSAPIANIYSHVHHVQNAYIALLSSYMLKIKPADVPPPLESKALIAAVQTGAAGGKFDRGWVSVNTRNFGSFYVAVDTIAPTITPRNFSNGKNVSAQ